MRVCLAHGVIVKVREFVCVYQCVCISVCYQCVCVYMVRVCVWSSFVVPPSMLCPVIRTMNQTRQPVKIITFSR